MILDVDLTGKSQACKVCFETTEFENKHPISLYLYLFP